MAKIEIKEIGRVFKNTHELTEYVITQNKALAYATDKIRELEEKFKCGTQVAEAGANIKTSTVVRSIPEALCQIEIDRLMAKAITTPLDFEETKKLDILIKNYYLAKEKEAPKRNDKPKFGDLVLTDEDLTKMAKQKITNE